MGPAFYFFIPSRTEMSLLADPSSNRRNKTSPIFIVMFHFHSYAIRET